MDNGMENRGKTVAIVIGVILAIVLLWFLFIRDGGEDTATTEPPVPTDPVVIDTGQDETDNAANQVVAGDNEGSDTDSSTSDGSDTTSDDTASSDEEVVLPEGWDDFSVAEKINANPYGCDLDRYPNSMWPDGTCHYPEGAEIDNDDSEDGDDDELGQI